MAGEWIKMRTDLLEDPVVFKLASLLKSDRLTIIGRLYAFWAWADKHAVDGRVDGASSLIVDDITRCDGFAQALVAVKWLTITDDSIALPKHERHNGESAKERAMKNARQARWREGKDSKQSTDVDAAPSTKPSTREEKRREEKKNTGAKAPSSAYAPPDWLPADQWAEFVKMRKAMRNIPFTDAAAKGVVADLEKLVNQGLSAEELLQAAVTNGWRTVYRPKAQHGEVNKQQALEDRNLAVARQWVEENHATQ